MALSGFKFLLSTPTGNNTPFQDAVPANNEFTVIGGLQSNSFNFTSNGVDITNKSSSEWRELLNNRGTSQLSLSGNGIQDSSNLKKSLEQTMLNQSLRWFKIEREDGRTYVCKAKITTYSNTGPHDGPLQISIGLESAGGLIIRDAGGYEYNGITRLVTSFTNRLAQFNYILNRKYASPSYEVDDIPEPADRTERMRQFINLAHGLPATMTYDNNIFSATVPAIGDQDILLEYVRLTGTTPQNEPDRGRWRITFHGGQTDNPFPKGIKSLRVAIGSANPVTIPLTVDSSVTNALAYKSTNALGADPVANTNDFSLQYNFVFTDDTSAYEEVNLLNDDKAVGGVASLAIQGRNVANRFSIPFLFLLESEVNNKVVQFLDSLDNSANEQFIYVGTKADDTGVVWRVYYLNMALGPAESYDFKVQIGV